MDTDLYRSLFVHRDDVFAEQHPDGSYRPVRRPLEELDVLEHLAGMRSLGSYVIDPSDNCVTFVVFDLDTYDEEALEWLCQAVEKLVYHAHCAPKYEQADRYRCLLLESSGGKGYHIWLFLSEPVPARTARYFAKPVKDAYDSVPLRRMQQWPALEIFPKQDTVPEGGFGNLVKLPLGIHAKSGKRSQFLLLQGWADCADNVQRLNSRLLPEPPAEEASSFDPGRKTAFPCITRIIEEGVGAGNRDNAMFHFARYCAGQGLPEDMALEWCLRVNQEFSPPLMRQDVNTKVRSAYAMESPHPSCKADWLEGFCPGGAHCHAPWNKPESGGLSHADRAALRGEG